MNLPLLLLPMSAATAMHVAQPPPFMLPLMRAKTVAAAASPFQSYKDVTWVPYKPAVADEVKVPAINGNTDGMSIAPYEADSIGGLLVNAYPPPKSNTNLRNAYWAKVDASNAPNKDHGEDPTAEQAEAVMDMLENELNTLGGRVKQTAVLYEGCCERTFGISWNRYPTGVNSDAAFATWMQNKADELLTAYAQDAIMLYSKEEFADTQATCQGDAAVTDNKHSSLLFNAESATPHRRSTICRARDAGVNEQYEAAYGGPGVPVYAYPKSGAAETEKYKECVGQGCGCPTTCSALFAKIKQ